MTPRFPIFQTEARTILSKTAGFIAEAGFTHSLTPARNCTFGCTYCYVPTMRVQGGLHAADWQRWGQFTTLKRNAPTLLDRELRTEQIIYCSPLVDPYQPTEESARTMPSILEALIRNPPAIFVIQTRGPLIRRDISLIHELAGKCRVRVSFSLTTDRDDIRRLYEPHCATFEERLNVVRDLTSEGIETFPTLAPLLPCNPEEFAEAAVEATATDIIGDPLHVRAVKPNGATTRPAAYSISAVHGHHRWFDPGYQSEVVSRIEAVVRRAGRRFAVGPEAFSWLARN